MIITTLSSKGQFTIPKALQEILMVKPGSKLQVFLSEDNDSLKIKPLKKSIIEQTEGSLNTYIPAHKRGQPFSKIMELTRKKTAQKLAKNL